MCIKLQMAKNVCKITNCKKIDYIYKMRLFLRNNYFLDLFGILIK